MTYGQIALIIGYPGHARLVGRAISSTSEYLDIPCHRVVNSKGGLAPSYAFGGEGRQHKMLVDEGVCIKENGCVDLKKSIWKSS